MSADTFEIVQKLNPKALHTQLLLQCAPVISGLKVSNLFIINRENEQEARDILEESKLSVLCLARTDKKVTLLLYRKKWLKEYLQSEEVRQLLHSMGCGTYGFYEIIFHVKKQYEACLEKKEVFPHVLGLLLGYPAEDVKGYMENKGRKYLCTGYWQVYANPAWKMILFQKFELAKETLIHAMSNGMMIQEIIQLAGG